MKKLVFLFVLALVFTWSVCLAEEWVCPSCGKTNTTNFCTACGTKRDAPPNDGWTCPKCGAENTDAFCGDCGAARPVSPAQDEEPAEAAGDSGIITGLSWSRRININRKTENTGSGWNLPAGAILTRQSEEVHHYENVIDHYEEVSVQRSRQVIDHVETYYTYEDNGEGSFVETAHERPVYTTEYYTETVQQPVYRQEPVYQTKYYYKTEKWEFGRRASAAGNDHEPYWPEISLRQNEREGRRTEEYAFTALVNESTYTFIVDIDTWNSLSVGDTVTISKELALPDSDAPVAVEDGSLIVVNSPDTAEE